MSCYDDATQARCPECDHNLGDWATPHIEGCKWQKRQMEMARNVANDPAHQNAALAANRPVFADED